MLQLGLTDHVEGGIDEPSEAVFERVAAQTVLADELGFDFAWFAEHHGHVHRGHLPAPVLFALHLAGRTRTIRLGSAVVCLNLHHPLDVAEQIATADRLMNGRGAFGFGSGSSPEEFACYGLNVNAEAERHRRCEQALGLMHAAWRGEVDGDVAEAFKLARQTPLPRARPDLPSRCWLAVNSVGAARIAGSFNLNVLFSHLRTPEQHQNYARTYREAGGTGLIAANRPIFVARDDAAAWTEAEPTLRKLWRRFQSEGKIDAALLEPADVRELAGHPINFIVGGPRTAADALRALHAQCPFDVANLEVRWDGLPEPSIQQSVQLIATKMRELL